MWAREIALYFGDLFLIFAVPETGGVVCTDGDKPLAIAANGDGFDRRAMAHVPVGFAGGDIPGLEIAVLAAGEERHPCRSRRAK